MFDYFTFTQTKFLKGAYSGSVLKKHLLVFIFLLNSINFSAKAQDLTLNWAFSLNGSSGGSATAKKIVKDASGYTYVTGSFTGSVDFDPGTGTATLTTTGGNDFFLAKYDASGNYVWAFSFGTPQSDVGFSLRVDGSGNIYVTGQFGNSPDFDPSSTGSTVINLGGGLHTFLAKYDGSGNFLWVKGFGVAASTDIGYDLALDVSGNILMIGTTSRVLPGIDYDPGSGTINLITNGLADIVIAKYDGSGNSIWAKNIGGTGADTPYSLALDSGGNVYITGSFTGTVDFDHSSGTANITSGGGVDIFLAKYDGSGNYVWAKGIGSTNSDIGYALALDGSDNIYVTGCFSVTVDFDPGASTANLTETGGGSFLDIFLAKYDGSGNYLWAKKMGGYDTDNGSAIVLDGSGNAYITGTFYKSATNITTDFDPGSGSVNLTAVGVNDIFIGKYDASGNYLWAKSFGGSSNDYGYSVSLDANGNVLLAGGFNGTIDFDPGSGTTNLVSTGTQDVVIASYASQAANNTAGAASSTPTLCINTALTNITHSTTGATGIGTATGLPTGVSAAWASNIITISGTPTTSGTFNYTIPLTGGTGSVNATGTITVVSVEIASSASSNSICSGASVTFTAIPTGASSPTYQWKKNAVNIPGETAVTYTTTTLSNNDAISVDMTASGVSSNGSIVSSNLVLNLDAGNSTSYPGSGTAWTDLSGNGNNGTFVGNLSYNSSEGGSVVFSGGTSNDYVSIANSSSLNLTTAGTLSIWINPSSLTQRALTNLIGRTIDGATNGQSYYLYWTGGSITGIIQNGGVYKSISTPVPTVLGWYNYVFSWGNGYLKLYKNGEQASTPVANTMSAQSLTTTVNIGGYIFGNAGGSQNTFNGKIPIVHIYSRSLSDAEVLQNFNSQKSRFLSTPISSNIITTTVTAVNTASAASSTPTGNINTPITNITHTTTGGATGIGTPTGLPAGVNAAWASNTITISGTPTNAGTFNYTIPLTGGCGTVNATGTIIVLSSYTWTGSAGDDMWGNGNNWSTGAQPNAGAEIVISSGNPKLNADYTVAGSLTLSGTSTLTVNAGKTLSIASGGVADFGGKLVTFKSDATGTGQLGEVTGTLTGATNVVIERHIPAGKRAFRFFSSSVTTTGSILDNWMEGATPGVNSQYPYTTQSAYNPNPGYGTHITGSGGNANGFDQSGTNNPSLFTFNNSTGAWAEVTSTAGTISAGSAYRMLVRGNRSYAMSNIIEPSGESTILRTIGTIATGTQTSGSQLPALSQVLGGWSLVGNPYQSVVDMSAASVVKTNLTNYYYIWDPRMGTQGAYVAYNYVTNTSANTSSGVNRYVQPGQAFFMQSSASGSAIQFTEAAKGAASNQTATFGKNDGKGNKDGYTIAITQQRNEVMQTGGFASLSMLLYQTDSLLKGGMPADAARVLFEKGNNNIVDVQDGRKLTNLDEMLSVRQSNTLLSMELRALPDTGTVLPLNISQYRGTKYTLRVYWDKMLTDSTKKAYLKDKFTAKEYLIERGGNYIDLAYTITSDAKSSAADRFEVVFRGSANVVTAVTNWSNGDYIKVYPNPVISLIQVDYKLGMQRELTLKVYDMSGREVLEQKKLKSGEHVNMSRLLRGIYQYQLLDKTGKLLMAGKVLKD